MNEKGFSIVEKNGIRLISVDCINQTGVYNAYYSTGYGGVSTMPGRCTMNLSLFKNFPNDSYENIKENFRLFVNLCGTDLALLSATKEVHGNNIVEISSSSLPEDFFDRAQHIEADGQVTKDPSVALFVYAADCSTILIVDPINGVSGATHCGWRNSANGTIDVFISKYRNLGGDLRHAIVAIGPTICSNHYDVDNDAAKSFKNKGLLHYLSYKSNNGRWSIDLPAINRQLLIRNGLANDQIFTSPWCNCCDVDLCLPSHRRDGANNASYGGVLFHK